MLPTERIEYSPIHSRADRVSLPGDANVAVWLIVNVEEWDPLQPMPRTVLTTPPAGGVPTPDIPNWAWHEYGNRVGFWRLLSIIDKHSIPAVLAINGAAIDSYPPIVEAAIAREWEFIGHGLTQRNMQKVDDERLDIRLTTEAIERASGVRPRGWLGPGLTETWETPDILVEEGYDYVCDWVLDDLPTSLTTRSGRITSIPYTQECNDVAMMLIQHHPAAEYRNRAIDQFTQLREDAIATGIPRVMALVVHPYIMGAPHRARYVDEALAYILGHEDAVFCTGQDILESYLGASAHARAGASTMPERTQ